MPQTLFISDLHLQPEHPEITAVFSHFLTTEACHADALYLLGDFFEVWVGDDDDSPLITEVKTALKKLTAKIPVYIMPGNRDFLMGKKFAQDTGCQLIQDPTLINLYGISTVLTHGDALCLDDKGHQLFRRLTQKQWLKTLFLALPLSIRHKIARKIRHTSQRRTQNLAMAIMDITPSAAIKLLQANQAQYLIHGHTHRPAIHALQNGQKRIVLGAWGKQGSALICQPHAEPQLVVIS